jgi:hypothetical protein
MSDDFAFIERLRTTDNKILVDFVKYATTHSTERFWQAVRNWSGYPFVVVSDTRPQRADQEDTFLWLGRSHDEP